MNLLYLHSSGLICLPSTYDFQLYNTINKEKWLNKILPYFHSIQMSSLMFLFLLWLCLLHHHQLQKKKNKKGKQSQNCIATISNITFFYFFDIFINTQQQRQRDNNNNNYDKTGCCIIFNFSIITITVIMIIFQYCWRCYIYYSCACYYCCWICTQFYANKNVKISIITHLINHLHTANLVQHLKCIIPNTKDTHTHKTNIPVWLILNDVNAICDINIQIIVDINENVTNLFLTFILCMLFLIFLFFVDNG